MSDTAKPGKPIVEETLEQDINRGTVSISSYLAKHGLDGAGVNLQGVTPTPASALVTADRGRKYEIGGRIAQGGMGAILKARDLNCHRAVAMKVMLPGHQDNPASALRFIEEAQITAQLEHPNIVPVHELGVDSAGNVFYTMKLVHGLTLKQILICLAAGNADTLARWPLLRLLGVLVKVCDAVAFAHSRGVIHRDLKPENIMVGEFGEVVVMDWGLAKVLKPGAKDPAAPARSSAAERTAVMPAAVRVQTAKGAELRGDALRQALAGEPHDIESARRDTDNAAMLTMQGEALGTPAFMSPEQALGKSEEIDARTDIYALGGILYSILTLKPPVEGASVPAVLLKVIKGAIVPPAEVRPQPAHGHAAPAAASHLPGGRVPSALSAVAMTALARQPADRYAAVKEFQHELEAYLGGFATHAEHAGLARQASLLVHRHKAVSTVVTALLLVALGSAAWVRHAQIQELRAQLASVTAARERQAALLDAELEQKMRREEWLPVCDFDFSKETKLDPRFECVYCPSTLLYTPQREIRPDPNQVSFKDGCLQLTTSGGLTSLRWKEDIGDDVRITVTSKVGGYFTVAFGGDSFRGYRVLVGSNDVKKERDIVVELDTLYPVEQTLLARTCKSLPAAPPGQATRTLVVERSGMRIRASVDGVPFIDYIEAMPVTGPGPKTFALGAYWATPRFVTLKVERRRAPDYVPVLDYGRRLLQDGQAAKAEAFFRAEAAARAGTTTGLEATFLRGIALLRQAADADSGRTDRPGPSDRSDPAVCTATAMTLLEEVATVTAPASAARTATGADDEDAARRCAVIAAAGDQAARLLVERGEFEGAAAYARRAVTASRDSPAAELVAIAMTNWLTQHAVKNPGPAVFATSTLPVQEQERVLRILASLPLRDLDLRRTGVYSLAGLEGSSAVNLGVVGSFADLSPLRSMPLVELQCPGSLIRDLSPLRGKPLRRLGVHGNRIRDLTPLQGMPLETLAVYSNPVTDLTPIAGAPLEVLEIFWTQVSDLSPVRGMPLIVVNAGDCRIRDLSPLHGAPLEKLVLYRNDIHDLAPLAGMPLHSLSVPSNWVTGLEPLAGLPLESLSCEVCDIADLGPLANCPLENLSCHTNRIRTLEPLRGMRTLWRLDCRYNDLEELTPLAGLPLRNLTVAGNPVAERLAGALLSPIAETPSPAVLLAGLPKSLEQLHVGLPQAVLARLLAVPGDAAAERQALGAALDRLETAAIPMLANELRMTRALLAANATPGLPADWRADCRLPNMLVPMAGQPGFDVQAGASTGEDDAMAANDVQRFALRRAYAPGAASFTVRWALPFLSGQMPGIELNCGRNRYWRVGVNATSWDCEIVCQQNVDRTRPQNTVLTELPCAEGSRDLPLKEIRFRVEFVSDREAVVFWSPGPGAGATWREAIRIVSPQPFVSYGPDVNLSELYKPLHLTLE